MTIKEVEECEVSIKNLSLWQEYYETKLAIIKEIRERGTRVVQAKPLDCATIQKLREEGFRVRDGEIYDSACIRRIKTTVISWGENDEG